MKALHYLFCFSLLVSLAACKKLETEKPPEKDKFSFKYNGQTYDDQNGGNFSPTEQIMIKVPGLNSTITITTSNVNCSFMIPNNEVIANEINCLLKLVSGPIDSAKVYFYRSGLVTYSYSDCYHVKAPDFNGGFFEYDNCTVTGMFELTLGNNSNQTILITNGAFTYHGAHR